MMRAWRRQTALSTRIPIGMDDLQQLEWILRQVGPENVWRPVHVPGYRQLADGFGDQDDGLPQDLSRIDFSGKTVADIGCNFGYYVFLVKNAGARHVTGIDIDARIIRGCRILKKLYGVEGVSFLAADITQSDGFGAFDTGMMIDFIGKTAVANGLLKVFLDVLARLSCKEMILSVRPAYHLQKHLNADAESLRRKYRSDYVRRNHFWTIDYVRDRFSRDWEMEIVSPESVSPGTKKETLYFRRKTARPLEGAS